MAHITIPVDSYEAVHVRGRDHVARASAGNDPRIVHLLLNRVTRPLPAGPDAVSGAHHEVMLWGAEAVALGVALIQAATAGTQVVPAVKPARTVSPPSGDPTPETP